MTINAKEGEMAQVIVFPNGQLRDIDKAKMEEVGIIAIMVADPSKVVSVIPSAAFTCGDALLESALLGVQASGVASELFAKHLARAVAAQVKK